MFRNNIEYQKIVAENDANDVLFYHKKCILSQNVFNVPHKVTAFLHTKMAFLTIHSFVRYPFEFVNL